MSYRFIKVTLVAVVLMLLATQSAFADNVYATIRGTVTDQNGAVVPGAQITATNTLTGITKTITSQSNGLYEFLQLPTGTYTLTASKQNFKTFKSTGITLTVNQIYEQPVVLQIGVVSETVEVKAESVQVETTSIQQQTLINSKQIVDLPLINRDFTQLELLAPGVMSNNDRFVNTYSVNGSQAQQSSYLINGLDANDIALNTVLILPNPDAIQEFNLISSTINPEYGRNSGGVVNALIKSGTNAFHGNAFDFYRDTFLNTHNFFQKTAPVFHQNQFGGTLGGPILKDRTFFFIAYQGLRSRQPQPGAVGVVTTFSPAQRAGDFSADAVALSTGQTTPFPLVGDDGNLHPANTPFFGTGTTGAIFNCGNAITATVKTCSNANFGKIGTSAFNSISKNLMNQFIPLPNTANNQFTFNPTRTIKTDQGIARVDHTLGASDQIWGSAIFQHSPRVDDLPFTGQTIPGILSNSTSDIKMFTVAYNHTFSASMLNEVRLGYALLNFQAVIPNDPALPSSFGFTGINPQNTAGAGMPVITLTGFFRLGFSLNGPQPRKDSNYQFTDNFSKIVGKHSFKAGFDARRFQVDNPFYFQNDGAFGFGGNGQFTTHDVAADFLLGIPDSYSQNSGGVINARAYEYYSFFQDQWKIKSNLTLTYGTGWQIDTPFHNKQFGGLAYNCFFIGQQSTVFPTAPKGLNFPGDTNCNDAGSTTKYNHLAPTFGFAWSPNWGAVSGGSANKMVVRGGYRIAYNRYEEETALQNLGAPPFGIGSGGIGDFGGSPAFANPFNDIAPTINPVPSIPNKFPFVPPAAGSAVDFSFFEPLFLNTNDPSLSTPYSHNYNINIQRELPGSMIVSVGYVGALGRNLYRSVEGNPITAAGQAACKAASNCGGSSSGRLNQRFFFPSHALAGSNPVQCPAVGGACFLGVANQITDGESHYNSLQANLTKRMSHGLQLITSYTWSHNIDNGSGFENSSGAGTANRITNTIDPTLDIGDSLTDARQRWVFGYTYQIPSLHHIASWAPEKVVGGWSLTGITTFQTGFPVNIGTTSFTSLWCDGLTFFGGCPDNPNQVSSITTLNPRTSTFNGKLNYWFDPSAFAQVPTCTYDPVTHVNTNGNVCGQFGNVRRNSLHGPGINNFDMALLKDTKINERMSFQVGLEGYNVFNHTQFLTPSSNINNLNTFGRITSASSGRLVQLRAQFNF